MKISHLLSFGVLVGLMTTVGGAVVSADDAAAPVGTIQQSQQVEMELLTQLNSQPTFSDSTLRRPF
jgi:hypothetical protein